MQRRSGLLTLVGVVMLVIWALTARFGDSRLIGSVADGALLDHKAAVLRVVELVCRVLITTAVFSHLLLQVTDASWRFDRGFGDPEAYRRHEEQMSRGRPGVEGNGRAGRLSRSPFAAAVRCAP